MNTKPEKTPAKRNTQADEQPALLVEILAPAGPRRRAGMEFGPAPTIVDPADLDEAARAAIEADPFLTVRRHHPAEVPSPETPADETPA